MSQDLLARIVEASITLILVTVPFHVQFPFDSCPSNADDTFVLNLAYYGTAIINVTLVWALLIMYIDRCRLHEGG